jgi:hypothetical protein
MLTRDEVIATLSAFANKPSTSHELRADSSEVFSSPPFLKLRDFVQTIETKADGNALLAEVAPLIRVEDPFRAAAIAVNCGTLTEMGGDPNLVAPHLLAVLPRHTQLACELIERQANADDATIFSESPDVVRAGAGSRYLLLATMTVFCRLPEYRERARENIELCERIEVLRDEHHEANFVAQLLSFTDAMELLVLAPNEKKGFRVALEAVSTAAHLFTLLQAELISNNHLYGDALDANVVQVARGEVPHTELCHDHARFHYYPWGGLKADGTLDETNLLVNIPVDLSPRDIPPFDGVPVMLVGPKVWGSRSWDSNFFANIHDALQSRVEIVSVLSQDEVNDWLSRIAKART